MIRERFFHLITAAALSGAIAAGAGCTGLGGGGGGSNPTPTPPIPAGIYYANTGQTVNAVAALSSAPVASGGNPSPLPGSPFSTSNNGAAGAPFGIALAKGGTLLYAVNSSGSVTALTVNADGTLTLIAAGTTNVIGAGPAGICVDPQSKLAAVADTTSSSVDTFTIGVTNVLVYAHSAAASSNGLNQPVACVFSADSKYLYVTNSAGVTGISAWAIAADGSLAQLGSFTVASANFQGIATTGSTVFAASQTGNELGVFSIAANGTLTNPQVLPLIGTCAAPIGVALAPNGLHVYLACAAQRAVDGYSVNGVTLTHLPGAPYPTLAASSYLAIGSAGTLLVALDPSALGVTLFAIKGDGTLGFAPVNLYSIGVPAGSNPKAVVVR